MKDVIISIKGLMTPDMIETDDLEFETEGHYSYENGQATFDYMESELTGMSGTHTSFSAGPEEVTISREGQVNTCMRFKRGEKQFVMYETPFGSSVLGLHTHGLKSEMRENGGSIDLKYSVDYEGMLVSRNHVRIYIREARGYRI